MRAEFPDQNYDRNTNSTGFKVLPESLSSSSLDKGNLSLHLSD
jgi:hypothetical protein